MIIDEIDATSEEYFNDSLTEEHEDYVDRDYSGKINGFNYDYDINDCVLVRTTNHFPFGGVIQTPENARGVIKDHPNGMKFAIYELLKDYPEEERKEIESKLEIKQRVRRKTLHFCVNGLVGSHLYGDFSGRPFIIVEPLKYHIDSKELKTLRVEDTYFKEDIVLSNEAVIIIKKEVYEKIKDDERYKADLASHKIVLFTGDNETYAVGTTINKMGYDVFIINNHGYVNGIYGNTPANKMYSFIADYAQENNFGVDPHYTSAERYETIMQMLEESAAVTKNIVQIMAMELNKSEKDLNRLYKMIDEDVEMDDDDVKYMTRFIKEYGLEKLIVLVAKMNEQFDQEMMREEQGRKL